MAGGNQPAYTDSGGGLVMGLTVELENLAKQAATAGAKLFDRLAPGWENVIKPLTLDVLDPDHCPCTQVFGSFHVAVMDKRFNRVDLFEHGMAFDPDAVPVPMYDLYNHAVTGEWIKQAETRIREQRQIHGPVVVPII